MFAIGIGFAAVIVVLAICVSEIIVHHVYPSKPSLSRLQILEAENARIEAELLLTHESRVADIDRFISETDQWLHPEHWISMTCDEAYYGVDFSVASHFTSCKEIARLRRAGVGSGFKGQCHKCGRPLYHFKRDA